MPYKADRNLYHNSDKSKVVEEGDAEAAFLAIAEGQEVSDAEAKRLGLDQVQTKQVQGPPEDKAQASPDATRRTPASRGGP